MKRIGQQDLRKLYAPVPAELYDRIDIAFASLTDDEEKGKMKKHISFGAVLSVILVFALVSAAFAAGVLGINGLINWRGEILETDQESTPLATGTPAPASPDSLTQHMSRISDERMGAYLAGQKEGELLVVSYLEDGKPAGCASRQRTSTVSSLEELRERLADADYLTLPGAVPNGYAFADGYVILGCSDRGYYELISSETTADGYLLEHYQSTDGADIIIGYDVTFRAGSQTTDYLSIHDQLFETRKPSDPSIGIHENETVTVEDIPGMDNAIGLVSEERSSLLLRRVLDAPIGYMPEYAVFPTRDGQQTERLTEEQIDVFAPKLALDTLIGLFAK